MAWSRPTRMQFAQSPIWNIFLITVGATFYAIGVQSITAPHGFVTGGVFGTGLLIWYATSLLTPALWYFIINIPLFFIAWFQIGRQFFLYSLYGTACTAIITTLIPFTIPIEDNFFAAVASGILCGAGAGIMLRTLGSGGGLDLVAVILNRKWNISIGLFYFAFNALLYLVATFTISIDLVIASFIQVFIASNVLEYVLRMFSNRKMVYIVSSRGEEIGEAIIAEGYAGATILHGHGAYSGSPREIILTVTSNIMLRRLENLVFQIDEHAMFIVENTFYVAGGKFPRKSLI